MCSEAADLRNEILILIIIIVTVMTVVIFIVVSRRLAMKTYVLLSGRSRGI